MVSINYVLFWEMPRVYEGLSFFGCNKLCTLLGKYRWFMWVYDSLDAISYVLFWANADSLCGFMILWLQDTMYSFWKMPTVYEGVLFFGCNKLCTLWEMPRVYESYYSLLACCHLTTPASYMRNEKGTD